MNGDDRCSATEDLRRHEDMEADDQRKYEDFGEAMTAKLATDGEMLEARRLLHSVDDRMQGLAEMSGWGNADPCPAHQEIKDALYALNE